MSIFSSNGCLLSVHLPHRSVESSLHGLVSWPVNRRGEPHAEGETTWDLGRGAPRDPWCHYQSPCSQRLLLWSRTHGSFLYCLLDSKTPPDNRWVCDSWLLCSQGGRTSCREQEPHWGPLEKSLSPVTTPSWKPSKA